MNKTCSRKQIALAVACALAFGFATSAARADGISPNSERQLWNDTSIKIWRNAYGECWRDNYGPPPGNNECNPAPIAQYVAPPAPQAAPAPVYVAPPAPPPAPVITPDPLPPRKTRG